MIVSRSETYLGCEASPGCGGLTIRPTATCPITLEQRPIETSLRSCAWTCHAPEPEPHGGQTGEVGFGQAQGWVGVPAATE